MYTPVANETKKVVVIELLRSRILLFLDISQLLDLLYSVKCRTSVFEIIILPHTANDLGRTTFQYAS